MVDRAEKISKANSLGARIIGTIHEHAIFSRRVRVLGTAIADLLPQNSRVLDVGSGSGDIAAAIMANRPDVTIEGVDVLVRDQTLIPVTKFDGRKLPFANNAFDCALLIDVLHHTDDAGSVMREVARVAPLVVVKDHYRNGPLAYLRLRLMDWVGNAPHGVRLPYNYLSRAEWSALWKRNQLTPRQELIDVPLYPFPISWIFGKGLHFISLVQAKLPASN